jgi:hypothetical protein
MKDGDKVWFKTKEDKLIQGVLKGKTVTSGKKKYRPPIDNLYKSLEGARKSQWRPRTYAKKEWEELGAAPRKAKTRRAGVKKGDKKKKK